ncbi:trehalose-phosphatase [Sodalis ligni]|uniref:Trehalose 6-phosphate phosphatase n=1 Tax=Sodalis ligni TaxID=2697027 RepID=A0A4R1N5A7_9GAMM|nr:trehalose-phosphatase [Sodalis ligni]QWA09103.1 trehalose-phosphatase [Sodalis ligni]TCL02232.1 trehalose 6-phosphatase [Sodalis ligni]
MTDSEPLPPIPLKSFALFFDLDGTLAGIEKRPEWVSIPNDIKQALMELLSLTGGAVALVSGRALEELDALCAPLKCPAAGVHGAERRDARGHIHRTELSPALMATLGTELNVAIAAYPGCHVEGKGMAYALHYRQAEAYADEILALAETFTQRYPELALQPGKCVVELKPRGVDKGAAIHAFMHEAPFAGRTPLFIGDDLTDEAGFSQVNALGGVSIKVGPGETTARYHLDDVGQVHQWLLSLAKQQESQSIKTIISVGEDL